MCAPQPLEEQLHHKVPKARTRPQVMPRNIRLDFTLNLLPTQHYSTTHNTAVSCYQLVTKSLLNTKLHSSPKAHSSHSSFFPRKSQSRKRQDHKPHQQLRHEAHHHKTQLLHKSSLDTNSRTGLRIATAQPTTTRGLPKSSPRKPARSTPQGKRQRVRRRKTRSSTTHWRSTLGHHKPTQRTRQQHQSRCTSNRSLSLQQGILHKQLGALNRETESSATKCNGQETWVVS